MDTTKKIEKELQENVRNRVKNVEKIKEVEKFVNANLLDVFSSPDFFVDGITERKLNDTIDSIRDVVIQADEKIERLLNEYWATWDAARKAAIKTEIKDIEDTITWKITIIDVMTWDISRDPWYPYRGTHEGPDFTYKREDYEWLKTYANNFDLSTTKLSWICKRWDSGAWLTMDLDWSFLRWWATSPDKYYIVWEDGKEIKPYWWKYKLKMSMADGTEKDIEITWISIDPVTHQLKISKDVTFTPDDIDTTKPLEFNVAGAYLDVPTASWIHTWINVVHAKKIEVTLEYDTVGKAVRRGLFDTYNTSVSPRPIEKALEDTFTDDFDTHKYNHHIERKVLEKILKKFNAGKYDSLNEEQKEKFFQRMLRGGWKAWWDPKLEDFYAAWNVRLYDTYRERFIDDDKKWNKDPNNVMSKVRYIDFIKDQASSQDKCKEFIESALEKEMGKEVNFKKICARFTEFLDEIEENKTDNDMNERMDKDFFKKEKKSLRMKRWPRSPFRPRDVNYMRFFNWSSKSMKGETVNIYTREWIREKWEKQPFKYDLDMNITWKNSIDLTIKIDWEKSPISIKSGEPWTLARRILRDNRIPYWKARAHMCFNVYRVMVEMAKDNHMSLKYRDSWKLREIDFVDGNLVMKERNEIWYKSDKPEEKFTQKVFLWVNDFERDGDADDIWVLRRWIEWLWLHFNKAMNTLHRKYRKWVERRFVWALHSRNRFRLPVTAWTSPIKKLLNCKTVSNFDFSTTVESKWESINIDFARNKFTINMNWLKKPISSRDLWKLLNHREWRIRVFDGMERDIVEGVYVALISRLRENSKIARTSFWFVDDVTWRLYVLDKDWDFWYIPRKDRKGFFGHPMRWLVWWIIPGIKKFWALKDKKLSRMKWYTKLDPETDADEIHEIMKNPFLMQRLVRAMNRRMGLLESMRSIIWS